MEMTRIYVFVFPGALAGSVSAVEWQALPEKEPAPADNLTTPEKVELGQMLYMDLRFSSTGTV